MNGSFGAFLLCFIDRINDIKKANHLFIYVLDS